MPYNVREISSVTLKDRCVLAMADICKTSHVLEQLMNTVRATYDETYKTIDFGDDAFSAQFSEIDKPIGLGSKINKHTEKGAAGAIAVTILREAAKRFWPKQSEELEQLKKEE